MNLAIILQNQTLYLTTLCNRKSIWFAVKASSQQLVQFASSKLNDVNMLKERDRISLQAAVIALDQEIKFLTEKHGETE